MKNGQKQKKKINQVKYCFCSFLAPAPLALSILSPLLFFTYYKYLDILKSEKLALPLLLPLCLEKQKETALLMACGVGCREKESERERGKSERKRRKSERETEQGKGRSKIRVAC